MQRRQGVIQPQRRIADYALAIGGILDRPQVHRTAGSGWASPRRAPQGGRQLVGQFPHRASQHVGHACHVRGGVALLVVSGARDDHRSRDSGMLRADGDPRCLQRRESRGVMTGSAPGGFIDRPLFKHAATAVAS
jgi:hypothetical protein